jgi:hypothetical protein
MSTDYDQLRQKKVLTTEELEQISNFEKTCQRLSSRNEEIVEICSEWYCFTLFRAIEERERVKAWGREAGQRIEEQMNLKEGECFFFLFSFFFFNVFPAPGQGVSQITKRSQISKILTTEPRKKSPVKKPIYKIAKFEVCHQAQRRPANKRVQ